MRAVGNKTTTQSPGEQQFLLSHVPQHDSSCYELHGYDGYGVTGTQLQGNDLAVVNVPDDLYGFFSEVSPNRSTLICIYICMGQCPAKSPFWVVFHVFKVFEFPGTLKSFYQMVLTHSKLGYPA